MDLRHGGAWYQVSPWGLSWDDENYYLVAYDAGEEKIKHYRVDKMRGLRMLEEPREGEEHFRQFDMGDYARKNFGMFSGRECRVRLLMENAWRALSSTVLARMCHWSRDEEHFAVNVDVYLSGPVPSLDFCPGRWGENRGDRRKWSRRRKRRFGGWRSSTGKAAGIERVFVVFLYHTFSIRIRSEKAREDDLMGKVYFTLTGTQHYYGKDFLKKGMKVRLIKEPENEYDREAIRVELPGLGKIGYVANSTRTVLGESHERRENVRPV